MQLLTIGKIAKQSDVGIETIRFYEREGLLDEPSRKASGYRQYPAETVDRVRFIKRAKELGFSLKEIKELLALSVVPGTTCGEVKQRAEAKLDEIEDKIRALQRMKRALKKLTAACSSGSSVRECPIMDALEDTTP